MIESFSVPFFSLLNPILSGFSLSKAPAGIILYRCVKSNLKNKLLFKNNSHSWVLEYIAGFVVLFIHNYGKAETIDLVNIL